MVNNRQPTRPRSPKIGLRHNTSYIYREPIVRKHQPVSFQQPIIPDPIDDDILAKQKMVDMLIRSVDEWNRWRTLNASIDIDLSGANLEGACLEKANLGDIDAVDAKPIRSGLLWMYLFWSVLRTKTKGEGIPRTTYDDKRTLIDRAKHIITVYKLFKNYFAGADQNRNSEIKPNNEGKMQGDIVPVNLKGANLKGANLTGAILDGAVLDYANLEGANLKDVHIAETSFIGANLSNTYVDGIIYYRFLMGGKYRGVRIDSCYGNAIFRRDAQDQDYIDSLWARQRDILDYSLLGTYIHPEIPVEIIPTQVHQHQTPCRRLFAALSMGTVFECH